LRKIVFYTILFFFSLLHNLCFGNGNQILFPETKILSDIDSTMRKSPEFIYLQKGISFIQENQLDSAHRYLLISSESSYVPIKVNSFFYLNFIEVYLGNYEQSIIYLEQYHNNANILYNQANRDETSAKQQEDLQKILSTIKQENKKTSYYIGALVLVFSLIIGLLLYFQNKKRGISFKQKKEELNKLESTIDQKRKESQAIDYNKFLIEADVFKNIPIYFEIKQMELLKKDNYTKVLTYEKQLQLQEEIEKFFPNFIQELKNAETNLTSNDIRLCCLSLLPLTVFTKALCFGSTETNIVKQRKYQIKKKMTESNDILLFNFIFVSRK